MRRRSYDLKKEEGISPVLGAFLLIIASLSAVLVGFIIVTAVSSPLGPFDGASVEFEPIKNGVRIIATEFETTEPLRIACGSSVFELSPEKPTGTVYAPNCDEISVTTTSNSQTVPVATYPVELASVSHKKIIVASDGTGDTLTLKQALNQANAGATIILKNTGLKTVYDGSVSINTPITLLSDSGVAVRVSKKPLTIDSPNVELSHITVESGQETIPALISVRQHAVISDASFETETNQSAVIVDHRIGSTTLSELTFTGHGTGFTAVQGEVRASALTAHQSLSTGLSVTPTGRSHQIYISDSYIYGLDAALIARSTPSTQTEVRLKNVSLNSPSGIVVDSRDTDIDKLLIEDSSFNGEKTGIHIGVKNKTLHSSVRVTSSLFNTSLSTPVLTDFSNTETPVILTENYWGSSTEGPRVSSTTNTTGSIKTDPWCIDATCSLLS